MNETPTGKRETINNYYWNKHATENWEKHWGNRLYCHELVEETKGTTSTSKSEVKDNTVIMFKVTKTTKEETYIMGGSFKKNIDSFV